MIRLRIAALRRLERLVHRMIERNPRGTDDTPLDAPDEGGYGSPPMTPPPHRPPQS